MELRRVYGKTSQLPPALSDEVQVSVSNVNLRVLVSLKDFYINISLTDGTFEVGAYEG